MAQSNRFWNWIARRYSRMKVQDEAGYQEKLRRTQALLQPDWQVLEFGCGTGTTALQHAPHVAHIKAFDFSPKMVGICREKAADAGVQNVSFEVAAVDGLDAAEGSVDAVLAMSVLHLVENRDAVIGAVFRMLRPGGIFVSSTACLEGQAKFFLGVIAPVGHAIGILPGLFVFRREDLVSAIKAAGFEIEDNWQPDENPKKAVFVVARKPGGPERADPAQQG